MPGTRAGGLKAAATNKRLHGKDFYKKIGKRGGKNGHTGGFASDKVDKNGLTGYDRARIYGKYGGSCSSRRGIRNGEGASYSARRYRLMEVIDV